MMKTPIYDFLKKYANSAPVRLHMPGHKGVSALGAETFDITEVNGADSLYSPDGIIKESEDIASELFGSDTYYSAEGSSLAIRAMLYLALLHAGEIGRKPKILAGRNAHKVFISGAALLDLEVEWLFPEGSTYLSCNITPSYIRERLSHEAELPAAVYITSPDYLGNMADIEGIAHACHDFGVLLLVDNAHGAYLKFLSPSQHPIDLGADMCADSAHKTLPSLTGGAYLHISRSAPKVLSEKAKCALSLFGSTSPSYLILASLDLLLEKNISFDDFCDKISRIKAEISQHGYALFGNEPMKITIDAKPYGYTGSALSEMLAERGVVAEFADPDYLVLMPSPKNSDAELSRLLSALFTIPRCTPIESEPPALILPEASMTPRKALLSPSEEVSAESAEGRILAAVTVGCPPAVPVLVSGELVSKEAISAFKYYGIDKISVVK